MISQKMINWGSQGCGIREIAAYGEARAAVVGAENVFNFTIGNPERERRRTAVARSIRHLLDTVPAGGAARVYARAGLLRGAAGNGGAAYEVVPDTVPRGGHLHDVGRVRGAGDHLRGADRAG